MAIDGAKGNVLWSQQLKHSGAHHAGSAAAALGVSPSYANGILVCPTGAGSIVAVDLATQWHFLWGYATPRHQPRGT